MKRLLALIIILALALPSLALAVEEGAALPEKDKPKETQVESDTYAFIFFGYTVIIAPADKTIEGDTTTFAVVKIGKGEAGELLANYRLGNTFGMMVSTMARITLRPLPKDGQLPADKEAVEDKATVPTHGQTVSAFVHELIRIRRETRANEQVETKDQLRLKIQERVRAKIMLKLKIHNPETEDTLPAEASEKRVEDVGNDAKNFNLNLSSNAKPKGAGNLGWTAYENETRGQKTIEIKNRNHIKNGKTDEAAE